MRLVWCALIAATVLPLQPLWAQPAALPSGNASPAAAGQPDPVEAARRQMDAAIAAKGPASSDATDAVEALAAACFRAGRKAEAVPLMRAVVSARERGGSPEALAMALNRLAIALDDPRETEALARRAVTIAMPITGNRAPLALAYANLGDGLHHQRRFAEADTAYRQALEVTRSAVGDDSPSTAARYLQLARNLDAMGKLAEAEAIYRRNLPILAAADGADHPDVGLANDMLAQNLLLQKRIAEAEPFARESLRVRERAFGADARPTFNAQETLANILIQQRKLPEAEAIARRLIARRTEARGTPFVDLVADRGRLGQILAMEKRKPESIAAFRDAVAFAQAKLDPGDPLLANALLSLGGAIVQANPADLEALTLARRAVALTTSERARALSRRGSRAQQALTRALGGDPAAGDLARFAGENFMLVSELRSLQFPAERAAMRKESFGIAQDLAQSAAGRAMAQTIAREAAGSGALAALVRQQQDLALKARQQSDALIAALGQGVEAEARLRAENVRLGRELGRVDARLRRAFPDYARMIAPQPLSEREAQARLRPGEGLLLIAEVNGALFLYGVSQTSAVRATAPIEGPAAKAMVARVRCNVDPLTCPGKPGEASADYAAGDALALYRALVAPVEPALGGVKTLYVTTSGVFADLPFAALLTAPPAAADLAGAPWLGDRYAFVSLPAVAVLHAGGGRRAQPAPGSFVGYGDPVLAPPGAQRGGPARAGAIRATPDGDPALADPGLLRTMPSLPGTEVELKAMARALTAPASAIRLGTAATEAAVRADPGLGNARVVAFATHGLLPGDIDGLAEPGLVFTPPTRATQADDGILLASEAAALRLSAEWVILSACNTASPEGDGGSDSLSALARAFLYAGAGSLLASHWRIGDEVTAALTVETLALARAHPDAGHAAALQSAMRTIRTGRHADGSPLTGWTDEWSHPAAWAPFALISNGD